MREAALAPGKTGWFIALLLAILLHMSLAVAAFWFPVSTPPKQARVIGSEGIEITLGSTSQPTPMTKNQQNQTPPEQPLRTEAQILPELEPQPEPKPRLSAASFEITTPQTSMTEVFEGSDHSTSDESHHHKKTAGNLPDNTQDYAVTLLAWLEQHKEYPRRARMRRQQGRVLLYFVVNRQGQVLVHRIHEGSGYPALDEEVFDMIKRAQPLPALPSSIPNDTLELVVPVQFLLR